MATMTAPYQAERHDGSATSQTLGQMRLRLTAPRPTQGGAPSHSPPDMLYAPGVRLAKGLGWFSIGLGLTEILAHRSLSRALGVNDHPVLLPLLGMREITSGLGILMNPGRPTGALWSRVAGDAMDLSLLGLALLTSSERARVLAALAAVAGVTAADIAESGLLSTAAALEG